MKVGASGAFSLINRLADIVEEEGISADLSTVIGDRFDEVDVSVIPSSSTESTEQTDEASSAMRSAVADHWAIQADDHVANAPLGPRLPGPSAPPTPPTIQPPEQTQTVGSPAGDLRGVAASLLDAESGKTTQGRMIGLSLVRCGLDALRRSGLTLLEPRFKAIAEAQQAEFTKEAASVLNAMRTEKITLDTSPGFGAHESMTFPEFIAWMREDLETGHTLKVSPNATADDARRALHQLDTLVNHATDESGVLNRQIVGSALEDIYAVINAAGSSDGRHGRFIDALPQRYANVLKQNAARIKFLYHFDQAYAKVPLPSAA